MDPKDSYWNPNPNPSLYPGHITLRRLQQLPYYAPNERLPAPLPTKEEIEASKSIGEKSLRINYVKIVNTDFVVKYGSEVTPVEGFTMLYVKKFSKCRVPEVYAIYQDQAITYIIMERIHGIDLMTAWMGLDDFAMADVVVKLKNSVNELRQLPSLGGYGKVNGSSYTDRHFPEINVKGVQKVEEEFIRAVAVPLKKVDYDHHRGESLHGLLSSIPTENRPVLTHTQLIRHHIILEHSGDVVIVDWADAAFYPRYYEYFTAMTHAHAIYLREDWQLYVRRILDPYHSEYTILSMAKRRLNEKQRWISRYDTAPPGSSGSLTA